MHRADFTIRRPTEADWPRVLEILESANFHRIGGPEMPSFPLADFFVAEVAHGPGGAPVVGGLVVGVGGYRRLDAVTAKTTLLAVDPAWRGSPIGAALQRRRQDYLRELGVKRLYTNVDDARAVTWYRRLFGYRPTGERIPKQEPFGRADKNEWINLMVEL